MARSTNRSGEDGDPRVTAPTDRDASRDLAEPRELSLEEVLKSYEQPINEEQAWAVCYQCCRTLAKEHRGAAATGASSAATPRRISGPGGVRIQKDGSVRVDHQGCEGKILYKCDCA